MTYGDFMINYKIDILAALKNAGYTTYTIKQENIFSQSTLQKFRDKNTTLTLNNIDIVCKLLNCQPGDIIEYVPDTPGSSNSD